MMQYFGNHYYDASLCELAIIGTAKREDTKSIILYLFPKFVLISSGVFRMRKINLSMSRTEVNKIMASSKES
jgi:hypothetical protein